MGEVLAYLALMGVLLAVGVAFAVWSGRSKSVLVFLVSLVVGFFVLRLAGCVNGAAVDRFTGQ